MPDRSTRGSGSRWIRYGAVALVLAGLIVWIGLQAGRSERAAVRPGEWLEVTPSPVARIEAIGAVVGSELYVFGGFLPGLNITDRVDAYDPARDAWSVRAPMPTPVTHVGLATDGPVVWLAGGFVGDHPGPLTDVVQVYDSRTDTWTSGPPLPVPRGGGALARVERKLHYFGGFKDRRQEADENDGNHFILDLDRPANGWTRGTPMPGPRGQLASAVVGGKIYALGGQFGHDRRPLDVRLVHVYDPASDEWSRLADLPLDRSHFEPGTFVLNGRIIIAGGRSTLSGQASMVDVTEYDPERDRWTPVTPLPLPLLGPVVQLVGDRIVVVGGGPSPQRSQATTWVRDTDSLAVGSGAVLSHEDLTRPRVLALAPPDGAVDVPVRAGIVSEGMRLPNGGIDIRTLDATSVRLFHAEKRAQVPGTVNTSAAGDLISFQPAEPLMPATRYVFEVNRELQDLSGMGFSTLRTSFVTGSGGEAAPMVPIAFESILQSVAQGEFVTSLAVGPDGLLYAGLFGGSILRCSFEADGTLVLKDRIESVNRVHGRRLVLGLAFDPSSRADSVAVWASHTAPELKDAADWTGRISRLSGPSLETVQDFVVGLPRSAVDHATNGIAFGPDGALYVSQGGSTGAGESDEFWRGRSEQLLSAAILRIDLSKISSPPVDVKTAEGGSYDPYAPGAPVTFYATGVRNAFDMVWHSNGQLYAPNNGINGPGTIPASVPGARRPDGSVYREPVVPRLTGVPSTPDYLLRVERGGYYGHPNPLRGEFVLNGANPTPGRGNDPGEVSAYPDGTPPDPNWRGYAFDFGMHTSSNGIIEYKGLTFGGALMGKLLVTQFSQGDDIVVLTPGGPNHDIVSSLRYVRGMTGFLDPLDLVEDPATGNLYVANMPRGPDFASRRGIVLLRPIEVPRQTTAAR